MIIIIPVTVKNTNGPLVKIAASEIMEVILGGIINSKLVSRRIGSMQAADGVKIITEEIPLFSIVQSIKANVLVFT